MGPARTDAVWVSRRWLVVVLLGLIALGSLLGLLAQDLLSAPLDRPVLRLVVENRSGGLTSAMNALTNLGAPALLLVLAIGLGWAWWAIGHTAIPLEMLLSTWVGAEILFNTVKLVIDRARPGSAFAVHHFNGLAFPSGHATQSAAMWGMVAALAVLSSNTRGAKLGACGATSTVALLVGITRIYLGAHWTSDVLGGWLLGGLWAIAVVWFVAPRSGLHRAGMPTGSAV